jgi:chromosome segregation ATPase
MPKKKNSIGELFDKKFDTLENKIDNLETKMDDGFKSLLKMHFEQNERIEAREEKLNNKLDKILSFVSNLVTTTESIKQDVTVINERVKQHEDKLELLS